jgi:hypothetical protein
VGASAGSFDETQIGLYGGSLVEFGHGRDPIDRGADDRVEDLVDTRHFVDVEA